MLGAVVAVTVPGAVGRQDQIAALRPADFTFDRRVAALVRQDCPAGIGRVDMGRGNIARLVDRHSHPDGVGDAERPGQPRIEEQELLAVGEFQRRDVGNAVEVGFYFGPAPQPGHRLVERRRTCRSGTEWNRRGRLVRAMTPGPFLRRVGAGSQPDIERRRLCVQPLHLRQNIGGQGRIGEGNGAVFGHAEIPICSINSIRRLRCRSIRRS
jgi:hypothetical protein